MPPTGDEAPSAFCRRSSYADERRYSLYAKPRIFAAPRRDRETSWRLSTRCARLAGVAGRLDNGPEFVSKELDLWAFMRGVFGKPNSKRNALQCCDHVGPSIALSHVDRR